jgi:SAM-dependent methyltransferase
MDRSGKDTMRAKVANSYLRGVGVEIGAGVSPHPVPSGVTAVQYDIRDCAALKQLFGKDPACPPRPLSDISTDFPQGCDFLIAHHVLEHSANPIDTLQSWHAWVRRGGIVVLSLPHYQQCDDRLRLPVTIDHLILDYLLSRGDRAFESKEHIAPFILAWVRNMWVKDFDGARLAEFVLSEMKRDEGHDLHWHAFEPQSALATVIAACLGGRRKCHLLACAHPDEGKLRTGQDILLVYRLDEPEFGGFPPAAHDALKASLLAAERGLLKARTLLEFA